MKALRPYQEAAIAAVHQSWADGESPMLVMATGTGKTFTAVSIIQPLIEAGHRIAWLAHREELLDQALADMIGHDAGVVQAGRDECHRQVVVCSVDTLRNRRRVRAILEHGPIDYIVVDECHHSTSPTHRAAIDALRHAGTRLLGLTATPHREDGADLSEEWTIAYAYDLVTAVAGEYLLPPYAALSLVEIDLEAIELLDDDEMGAELIRAGIVDQTVAAMQAEHIADRLPEMEDTRRLSAVGRRSLVFTASVEQARLTAEALTAAGISAGYISGTTAKSDRRRLLRRFREGAIEVLCNASVLTEGTDLPIASCGVLARPLRSWSLYVQCVGRVLRPYEGQTEGLLIDLAGSTRRHSLVFAPVLISPETCDHDYQPDGVCQTCGHKVPCLVVMGPHEFVSGACVACDAPQCAQSGDGRHLMRPDGPLRRVCIACAAVVYDQHSGIAKPSTTPDAVVKAAFIRIPDTEPECWGIDAGNAGVMVVVGSRSEDRWMAYWIKRKGRKLYPLTPGPLRTNMVRLYADDIVTRSFLSRGGDGPASSRQLEYLARLGVADRRGYTKDEASREIARVKIRATAIRLGACREL